MLSCGCENQAGSLEGRSGFSCAGYCLGRALRVKLKLFELPDDSQALKHQNLHQNEDIS